MRIRINFLDGMKFAFIRGTSLWKPIDFDKKAYKIGNDSLWE